MILSMVLQRLERILSNSGVGSRSEVAKILKGGRVSVDGRVVKGGSIRFADTAAICIDGEHFQQTPLLAVYHKPVGVLSTMKDGRYNRKCLGHLVDSCPFIKYMHPVGRLDADSSGLLLFSRDGILTEKLLNPKTNIRRDYQAVVLNRIDHTHLQRCLANGIKTSDGTFSADLIHSSLHGFLKNGIFQPLSDVKPFVAPSVSRSRLDKEGTDTEKVHKIPDDCDVSCLRLSVTEGKYRMVRRMLHNSGHSVLQLHRLSYGGVMLEDLPVGGIRPINMTETKWLKKALYGLS